MFLPRPKCRCVSSMIPGKIAMFSSLIKVPTLRVDDMIQCFSPTKVSTVAAMLQVLIVCKTLLLIVCRWCATVDRRNVAAFVRLLLAASERSLVPASQGSLVIICRTLFLIVCRCCATVAVAAPARCFPNVPLSNNIHRRTLGRFIATQRADRNENTG